jgi:hypothetical protein
MERATTETGQPGWGPLVTGAGGALMIISLFVPWSGVEGQEFNGWETWTALDIFFLIVGVVAIAAALTGGRIGLFRPDMSLNGAADLLGVVSTVLMLWLVLIEFQEFADREIGVYLTLIASIAIACGAGDWRIFQGAPAFPSIDRT